MAILAGNTDINKMQVGDEIRLKVYPEVPEANITKGKIIYIDPKMRFFRVEFTVESNGNIIRECFSAYGPRGVKDSRNSEASKVL